MTNEEQIRTLIQSWATAVHDGDLPAVLADHSDDIVVYDVPPPYDGVRGIEAYEQAWPPFFQWQQQGATFDIVELEVTAGDDVAFAFALLRCGGKDDDPANRLRLTIGLRKENGRWVVTHEHHSFPHVDDGETAVRAVQRHWSERTAAKDLAGLMENIDDDIVSYEHAGNYDGIDDLREVCRAGLETGDDVTFETPDLTVITREDIAVSWGLDHVRADGVDSWSRGTRVFRKKNGRWLMVHQHLSVPLDR
ncbi:nuclear transport factor 2 family protein [Fodinicola acaciae]|uniref:nuclear transport factor 2 family protein n=1 Tax=Fodinicola acaciae TaxID=2681555 RepID=UPI0013D34220